MAPQMGETVQHDYLSLNLKLLGLGGSSPPKCKNTIILKLYRIYTFLVIIVVVCSYPVAEILGMASHLNDIDAFTKLMGFALSHIMGAYKIRIWYSKSKEINTVINLLQEGEMFQYEKSAALETGTVTERALKTSRRVTWTFFILGTALPINASIVSWLTPAVTVFDETNNSTLFLRKLPYDTWFPFEGRIMPFYPFAFLYQVFCVFIFATNITSLDTLYVSLIIHTTNKIKILKLALSSMRQRLTVGNSDELYDPPLVEFEMQAMLKKCIIHHQTIIKLTKILDTIIRTLLLGQFFATTFILCTSLFLLSINPIASMKFVNELSYLMAATFQLLIYCWFGNGITYQSGSILKCLYESDWLSSSSNFKRTLLIMMTRAQRPLRLNIGIFAPLTLQTFVTVVRGSYSYFAVLNQMDLPEE